MVKKKKLSEKQTHIRVYLKDKKWFEKACKKHGYTSSQGFRLLLRKRLRK